MEHHGCHGRKLFTRELKFPHLEKVGKMSKYDVLKIVVLLYLFILYQFIFVGCISRSSCCFIFVLLVLLFEQQETLGNQPHMTMLNKNNCSLVISEFWTQFFKVAPYGAPQTIWEILEKTGAIRLVLVNASWIQLAAILCYTSNVSLHVPFWSDIDWL